MSKFLHLHCKQHADFTIRRSSYNNVGTYSQNGIFSVNQKSDDTWSNTFSSSSGEYQTDVMTWTYTPTGTILETGGGDEFLPPYIAIYAWYRTA